jgi:hypothetical protein
MDKVQKHNSFSTNTPSSESYRNYLQTDDVIGIKYAYVTKARIVKSGYKYFVRLAVGELNNADNMTVWDLWVLPLQLSNKEYGHYHKTFMYSCKNYDHEWC